MLSKFCSQSFAVLAWSSAGAPQPLGKFESKTCFDLGSSHPVLQLNKDLGAAVALRALHV